jgi:hypothetical protein
MDCLMKLNKEEESTKAFEITLVLCGVFNLTTKLQVTQE